MKVRAFWRAVKVESAAPPYDTMHLKVLYPALFSEGESQRNFSVVPADPKQAPFPVVIFFGGANCGLEMYQWLAVQLAERGLVVVIFNWVAENLPGAISLTPGVDLAMIRPDTYCTGSTAWALNPILTELESLQSQGILAGLLDLNRIILGGHSIGGRVALENADPSIYPQVVAAFSYGAHTAAPVMLGFAPDTILPLRSPLPILLIGGTCDGVIAGNSQLYGVSHGSPTRSILRTFEEAIAGGRKDTYLLIIEGANHFSVAYPLDKTTANSFLDVPTTQPDEAIRSLLVDAISLFIDAFVRQQPESLQLLDQRLDDSHSLVAHLQKK
jgi:dienelactone hydrolase